MQQNKGRKTRRRNPMLFCVLAALLIVLILIFSFLAMNSNQRYGEEEAKLNPLSIVRNIAVTPDPYLVTHAPLPSPTPSYLANGSEGEMVRQLQQRLKELGYYTDEVDGQYGNGTREAVRFFQYQHGLENDGVAGQQTLALLYSNQAKPCLYTPVPQPQVTETLIVQTPVPVYATPAAQLMGYGASGESVVQLQQRLQQLGYYTGSLDGQYGNGTAEAVRIFQAQHSLSADGIAGEKTLVVLFSANAKYITVTPTPSPVFLTGDNILLLVNRQNKLPEDFVPADLVKVKDICGDNMLYASQNTQGVRMAVAALNEMVTAAKADGISPWKIREGYRTYEEQQKIFDNSVYSFRKDGMSKNDAISATRQTVADPGCSEHHTGLAFDLNANNPDLPFGDTAQYAWLQKHCWEYGFIMRYTDEKEHITGFLGEEWHVRYVGKEHSLKMRDMGLCLEEYIVWLGNQ